MWQIHSGDEQEGDADIQVGWEKEDEIVFLELNKLPPKVKAVIVVGTVATEGMFFGGIRSARARLVNMSSGGVEICRFTPSLTGDSTAQFFFRVARNNGRLAAAASDHARHQFLRPVVCGIHDH